MYYVHQTLFKLRIRSVWLLNYFVHRTTALWRSNCAIKWQCFRLLHAMQCSWWWLGRGRRGVRQKMIGLVSLPPSPPPQLFDPNFLQYENVVRHPIVISPSLCFRSKGIPSSDLDGTNLTWHKAQFFILSYD